MSAKVFRRSREYFVSLTVGGLEVEEAGPFDDEHEAVMMARRSVFGGGSVFVVTGYEMLPIGPVYTESVGDLYADELEAA